MKRQRTIQFLGSVLCGLAISVSLLITGCPSDDPNEDLIHERGYSDGQLLGRWRDNKANLTFSKGHFWRLENHPYSGELLAQGTYAQNGQGSFHLTFETGGEEDILVSGKNLTFRGVSYELVIK